MLKEFLIAFFFGYLVHLVFLLTTKNHDSASIIWATSTFCFMLENKVYMLEQKIKKLEQLLGWEIAPKGKNEF